MSDNTFKFYLKKTDTIYYAVQNGEVIETETKTELKHGPVGWGEAEISYIRHIVYWGIQRQYSLDFKFVLDAAQILRHIYFTDGWSARPIYEVEKLDTYDFTYSPFYSCTFDFTVAESRKDTFSVPLIDNGLSAIIQNKRQVPFEVGFGDEYAMSISGIAIKNVVTYTPITFMSQPNSGTNCTVNLLETYRISQLGKGLMPSSITSTIIIGAGYSPFPFFTASTDGDTVSVKLKNMKIQGTINPTIYLIQLDQFGNPAPGVLWFYTETVPGAIMPDQSFDIVMNEGDRLYLTGSANEIPGPGAPPGSSFSIADASDTAHAAIEVSGVIQFTSTGCRILRYVEFAKALVKQLTNGEYELKSDFLSNPDTSAAFRAANYDNSPYNTMVTCGDALRGIPDPKIKTTLDDLFKDVWMRWMCGIGVEGNIIRIEPLSYFLDKSKELFHLEAKDIQKLSFLHPNDHNEADAMFNQLHIGYGNFTYDNLDGRDEFNTSQTYLLTETGNVVRGSDESVSPYRADMYGIEKMRNYYNPASTGLDATSTIDSPADNGVFVIEADPTPSVHAGFPDIYFIYRPTGVITGMADTANGYNFTLSPKRSLMRHLPRVRSFINKGLLQFQTTDKNPDVQSNFFAGNIVENADIDLSAAPGGTLFQWQVLEIVARPPYNLVELLNNGTSGYVSFEYNGSMLKGFILDAGIKPAKRDTYTFRLLSHPDNNLTPFINGH